MQSKSIIPQKQHNISSLAIIELTLIHFQAELVNNLSIIISCVIFPNQALISKQFYNKVMSQISPDFVKILITFTPDVNLDKIQAELQERYLFIQHIKRYTKNELLVSFESMGDLLEIDFIEEFGALSTKVRNSDSFCKEMNEQHHSSTQQYESSENIEIFSNKRETNDPQRPSKDSQITRRTQRLTSLEDEVIEVEEVLKKLSLFEGNQSFSRIDEQQQQSQEIQEQWEQDEKKKQEGAVWGQLLNGVVLTSLIVGGVKALRFFWG